ncbi:hypothetical protein DM75_2699 [Burkholderia mallei]|nr:hypothetical protein DM75_2699 [Burkholderia mallei]
MPGGSVSAGRLSIECPSRHHCSSLIHQGCGANRRLYASPQPQPQPQAQPHALCLLVPWPVVSARHASRFPQHANLHAVIAATGASRQMHAHAEPLVERQRTVEFVRQEPRDVLTFPQ